jgi:hypothetical protein
VQSLYPFPGLPFATFLLPLLALIVLLVLVGISERHHCGQAREPRRRGRRRQQGLTPIGVLQREAGQAGGEQ